LLSVDSESHAEAQAILAVALEVCGDLRINWIPRQVAFSDVYLLGDITRRRTQPWYGDVPSDHPVMQGDTFHIASSMKGRLSPVEWRPLIAASMIFYSKLNIRKIFGITVIVAPFVIAAGLGILALLSSIDFLTFLVLLTAAWLFVTLGPYLLVARYEKGLWLKADRAAADYVGTQNMINILERVAAFKIPETEGSRASLLPSLERRIASLKRYFATRTSFN
jgi:hypothetical protein